MREKLIEQINKFFRQNPTLAVDFANAKHLINKDDSFNTNDAARKWFNKHKKKFLESSAASETPVVENNLVSYSKDTDEYLFTPEPGSGIVGSFVLGGFKTRSIVKNYSNFNGKSETVTKISIAYGIPRPAVIFVLKALGITHDSLPFTQEEMSEKSDDILVDDMLEQRRFNISRKLTSKQWEKIKKESEQWNMMLAGKLNPFEVALKDFKYEHKSLPTKKNGKKSKGRVFQINLADTHLGDLFKSAYCDYQYNSEIAAKKIDDLADEIEEIVNCRTDKFSHCELVLLGDILNSCLDGLTRKGTHLRNDKMNEELFDFGLSVILRFTDRMLEIFGKVNFRACVGNHDSTMIYALMRGIEKAFRNDRRIAFQITNEFYGYYKVNNCFFMFCHGGADTTKFALGTGAKLENYINTILIENMDKLKDVKGKYFISGHKHSYQQTAMNNGVDFFIVSATTPASDHSRLLGFRNQSRATAFVIGENYIEEVLHIHLN